MKPWWGRCSLSGPISLVGRVAWAAILSTKRWAWWQGVKQLDSTKSRGDVVTEVPYDTAQSLLHDLTGVSFGSERMHTVTNLVAEGLTVCGCGAIARGDHARVTAVAAGRWRCPVVVLGIDGAYVPTRPESARAPQEGQRRTRAKRARWRGQWRDAQGLRFHLLDGDRIVHLLSWHQGQTEEQLGEALAAGQKGRRDP